MIGIFIRNVFLCVVAFFCISIIVSFSPGFLQCYFLSLLEKRRDKKNHGGCSRVVFSGGGSGFSFSSFPLPNLVVRHTLALIM